MWVLSRSVLSDSATPWTVARKAPLSPGILQARRLEWLPCPPPGDFPKPGIESLSLMVPALADVFFTTSGTWEVVFKYRPPVVSSSHFGNASQLRSSQKLFLPRLAKISTVANIMEAFLALSYPTAQQEMRLLTPLSFTQYHPSPSIS